MDHKKVNYPPYKAQGGEMKKIENCNYAVQLAKAVKFSVVGIDGKNIYDKNKNLTLCMGFFFLSFVCLFLFWNHKA